MSTITDHANKWFFGTNGYYDELPEGPIKKLKTACVEAPVTMLIFAAAIAMLGLGIDHFRGGAAFGTLTAFVVEHKEGAISLALLILGTRKAYLMGKQPEDLGLTYETLLGDNEYLYADNAFSPNTLPFESQTTDFKSTKISKFSKAMAFCKKNPVFVLTVISAITLLGLWLDHKYGNGPAFDTLTKFIVEHREGAIGLGIVIFGIRMGYIWGEKIREIEANENENRGDDFLEEGSFFVDSNEAEGHLP